MFYLLKARRIPRYENTIREMGTGKYTIYIAAIAIGFFTGLICVAFRYIVAIISSLRPLLFNHHNPITAHIAVFSAIFAALFTTGLLVEKFPKISGSGLPQTQALLLGRRVYKNPFIYLIVKFIGGLLTLCSGLSLGREGTSVQMGSLTGYITGNIIGIQKGKHHHLIASGAGAGISAAFTAPLSSSILIMESLQKVTITTTLICTLLAGGTAGIVAKLITPFNIYNSINVELPGNPQWQLIAIYLIMAAHFAFLGKTFSTMLLKGKLIYSRRMRKKDSKKTVLLLKQALLLASATWITGMFFTDMIGGDQTFLVKESIINGIFKQYEQYTTNAKLLNCIILFAVIAIISAFTILSHASGYPGGIFMPMMTIGGLSGKLFYDIIHICAGEDIVANGLSGYFILIGMSAFFIAVNRTPITGFILISEMTGHYETFFPTLIVGIMVYYLTQLMGVVPLNDLLYDFMIAHDAEQQQRSVIYIDIESGAYLCGKDSKNVRLPGGCRITEIIRNKKTIPAESGTLLAENDSIGIEVDSNEMEQLHRSIISLGTRP